MNDCPAIARGRAAEGEVIWSVASGREFAQQWEYWRTEQRLALFEDHHLWLALKKKRRTEEKNRDDDQKARALWQNDQKDAKTCGRFAFQRVCCVHGL
jgi:hypothetical protein